MTTGAAKSGAIAEAWAENANVLAEWAMARLVARIDVRGAYPPVGRRGKEYRRRDGTTGVVPKSYTTYGSDGKPALTPEILGRHFAAGADDDGRRIAGAHSTAPDNTCKWVAVEIDRHQDDDNPDNNLRAGRHWWDKATRLGFRPILLTSDGRGGYHLYVLFRASIPSTLAYSFVRWLTADAAEMGLPDVERFPKQPDLTHTEKGCGNFLRLPGKHHKYAHWSTAWDGERWLDGAACCQFLLEHNGDDPALIPAEAALQSERVGEAKRLWAGVPPVTPAGDNARMVRACQKYLLKMRDSVAKKHGHDRCFHATRIICNDYGHFTEAEQWELLCFFNAYKCFPPWSESELRHKFDTARAKGPDGKFGRLWKDASGAVLRQAQRPHPNGDGNHDGEEVRPTYQGEEKGDAWEGPVDPTVEGRGRDVRGGNDHAEQLLFRLTPSAEFARADYRQKWYVKGVLVEGQPGVLGGGKKSLKTTLGVDLAISLGTGTPFLNHFAVARRARVGIISGESGEATLQETARRVCKAKGVALEDVEAFWGFRLPQLSDLTHLAALADAVREARLDVLELDPLYLCVLGGLGAEGLQASNLYQMGPLFLNVAQTLLPLGCTPVLVHHFKLNRSDPYGEPQLEDLAFSGIQEFTRQWILTGRRERYEPGSGEHKLWLATGGSAGHSGLWTLDIDEGRLAEDFTGRIWNVAVRPISDFRSGQADAKEQARQEKLAAKDTADDTAVLVAVMRLTTQSAPVAVYAKVKAEARLPTDRMTRAVHRLVSQGLVIEEPVETQTGKNLKVKRVVQGLRRRGTATVGTVGTEGLLSGQSRQCPDTD